MRALPKYSAKRSKLQWSLKRDVPNIPVYQAVWWNTILKRRGSLPKVSLLKEETLYISSVKCGLKGEILALARAMIFHGVDIGISFNQIEIFVDGTWHYFNRPNNSPCLLLKVYIRTLWSPFTKLRLH